MRVTVLNLKGGTGKTTTAVYLAGGLARNGRTLLIDADPQRSALSWSEAAGGFAFPVTNPEISKATSLKDVPQIGILEEAAYNCGESLQATES